MSSKLMRTYGWRSEIYTNLLTHSDTCITILQKAASIHWYVVSISTLYITRVWSQQGKSTWQAHICISTLFFILYLSYSITHLSQKKKMSTYISWTHAYSYKSWLWLGTNIQQYYRITTLVVTACRYILMTFTWARPIVLGPFQSWNAFK